MEEVKAGRGRVDRQGKALILSSFGWFKRPLVNTKEQPERGEKTRQVANRLVQEKCYWGPGRGLGKQDSRCIHRKPETKLKNSLHVIKRLASAAERMVLPSLQAAQVAEAGLRLHGQPPSCRRLGPMRGVQRRQPLPSRMTSKCASLMLLSTRGLRPELPTGMLKSRAATSGSSRRPKGGGEPRRAQSGRTESSPSANSSPGTGLPVALILSWALGGGWGVGV